MKPPSSTLTLHKWSFSLVRGALLVLPILFILVGCREESPIQRKELKADYFPLAEGNSWLYVGGGSADSLADTLTFEVARMDTLSTGSPAWKMMRSWTRLGVSGTDSFYVNKTADELALHLSKEDPNPVVFLKLPPSDEQTWSKITGKMVDNPEEEPLNITKTFTVKFADTVTVFDKTYEKCFKVESHERAPDRTLMSTYDWYAPGVGRVKSVMKSASRGYEIRLIEYTLH